MKVNLVAEVTRVLEPKTTAKGNNMQTINIRLHKDDGGDFIKIVLINMDVGEINVGNKVSVEGNLRVEGYTDKEGKAAGSFVMFGDKISVLREETDANVPF